MYQEIPILDAARACNLRITDRTRNHTEVEASCPFCGDRGPGKYHLSLNVIKNQFRCNLCGAAGNSLTLFARLMAGGDTKLAYSMLTRGGRADMRPAYPYRTPDCTPEPEPAPLPCRHDVFYDLLELLPLYPRHRNDLLRRGLSEQRIKTNGYRSMPADRKLRESIAGELAKRYDLRGVPGFFTLEDGRWSIYGRNGLLIPYLSPDGLIQGMQIRLNEEDLKFGADGKRERKYRWFSSRGLPNGTKSGSFLHITGDLNRKEAYLTEGGLKGDIASYLSGDSLFICFAGINNISSMLRQALMQLNVQEAIEAVDMDKRNNIHVRHGLAKIRLLLSGLNIKHSVCDWSPALNGIDEYLLSQVQKQEEQAA